MIAQDVLLGRPRLASRSTAVDVREGASAARAVLKVLLASVIMFEAGTEDPLLAIGMYLHRGIGSWTGLPLLISPLEIILMIGVVLALGAAAAERPSVGVATLAWPMLLFAAMLPVGVIRGALAGGDMYAALWEVRYLLYVPACFVIARISLRRREHVISLLRVGLAAAMLFALEGVYRKLVLINGGLLGAVAERFFEHDDVIFLSTFLIFAFSALVFRLSARIRLLGVVAAPILLYTLLASNRRSGIIVLLVGLLVVALTLLVVKRRAFFGAALPILAATLVFFALTWNASGVAGQPARAIRSLYEPDQRDASSNLYRLLETYDINATIHEDPVLGVGFGREFHMVVPLPDLSWWPFWRFETHNNVLWIWLKTGLPGYVAFWVLMGTAMSRSAFAAKRLSDPGLRSAALFNLVALVGVIVFGYVDLAFTSGRTTVFLGIVLGMVAIVARLDHAADRPSGRTAEAPARVPGEPILRGSIASTIAIAKSGER